MMPFSRALGLNMISSEKDRVAAELIVSEALCTTGRIMHGGAVMAVADSLGAIGAFLNLPEGHKTTTTIESKTNWFQGSSKPRPARNEFSCNTTTSTARPISNGGARAQILLIIEQDYFRLRSRT